MDSNISKESILYSAGTVLAYKIAKRYYKNTHFVWCTNRFHSVNQPPTSDPQTICNTYLRHALSGDRHSHAITDNIAGILRGADAKLHDGVIDKKTYDLICQMVICADYEGFLPVLFIIDAKKVGNRCKTVDSAECANDESVEYNITDLSGDEFEIISFKDILYGAVNIYDRRAGE